MTEREGDIARRGEAGRCQPVGGVARLHPRRLGLEEDHREGTPRRRRARLPAEHSRPLADHRPQPHHRPRGRLSRELFLPRGRRAPVGRAAGAGLPRPGLHGRADGRRRRQRHCRRSSTTRSTASCWPRSRCPRSSPARCQAFGIPVVLFNRDAGRPAPDQRHDRQPRRRPGARRTSRRRSATSGSPISPGSRAPRPSATASSASAKASPRPGRSSTPAASATSRYARGAGGGAPDVRPRRPARRRLRLQRPHGLRGDGRAALRAWPAHSRRRLGRRLRRRAAGRGPPTISPPSARASTRWWPRR